MYLKVSLTNIITTSGTWSAYNWNAINGIYFDKAYTVGSPVYRFIKEFSQFAQCRIHETWAILRPFESD